MDTQEKVREVKLPETGYLKIGPSSFLPGQLGVITKEDFKKGEILFVVKGPVLPHPTKYSFAASLTEHVEPEREDGISDFGHYLNHSCNPNVIVRPVHKEGKAPYVEVTARHDIAAGTELAFDYATLEYEVTAAGTTCQCHTPDCRGVIVGFKDLPMDIVEKYKKEGLIPEYLLHMRGL